MFRRTWRAACCAALAAAGLSHAWGESPDAYGNPPERPAAVVNGVPITAEEVEAELRAAEAAAPLPEGQRRHRRMEALGLLIDNAVMRQFLDREAGPVSPEALNRRLDELEKGLAKENKSLAELCQDTGQTPGQLKAGMADQMRWSAYAAIRLTEEALRKHHEENRDFFNGTKVRVSQIALRVPANSVQEEEARIKARLVELRAHLLSDRAADFADLARRLSQDAHAARGGDVGYFPRKWAFDEEFARAAFALKSEGDLSEVVRTPFGFHLLRLTGRKEGEASPFEAVRETVRAFCAEELRQDVLARERKAAAATIRINLP